MATAPLSKTRWRAEQRGVVRGVLTAAALALLVLAAGYVFRPPELAGTDGIADRLAFAIKADVAVWLCLVAAVGDVANGRFFSAGDIQGSGLTEAGPRLAVKRAILQNTLEQSVLAAAAHLTLAALLRDGELILIPLMALLFVAGRFAFWLRYEQGAAARSFGFALTFYPTVLGFVLALLLLIWRG